MVDSLPPIIPIAPIPPDLSVCDTWYGNNIRYSDCRRAMTMMRVGGDLVDYTVLNSGYRGSLNRVNSLPSMLQYSSCVISVELAGPIQPRTYSVSPDDLKGMAGWVINQCAQMGIGGFVTKNLGRMTNYLIHDNLTMLGHTYPPSSAFLTVTITGTKVLRLQQPGNHDPSIPLSISALFWAAWERSLGANAQFYSWLLKSGARNFRNIGLSMQRGGNSQQPWWIWTPLAPDEMTYSCDAKLGAPNPTNCSSIDHSQLGVLSDRLMISPGAPRIISSGICSIAISTVSSITITWQQVQVALEALINLCISNPGQAPTGGTACYGSQTLLPRDNERDQPMNPQLTGLNALPPHVNLTVYEPGHFSP